jgi:hypothetical protein
MLLLSIILICLPASVLGDVQPFNITADEWQLPSTCISVINQVVACDTALTWAGKGRYEDDETLKAVCTPSCLDSLTQWLRRTAGACTVRYNNSYGESILPASWVENILEDYKILCLTNK